MLISHVVFMIFPLKDWCGRNPILFGYTMWTTFMYLIALVNILDSPLWYQLSKGVRNIPLITGISITGLWFILLVSELIKLLVHGKVFRTASEIVAAYVIVLGIPHAAFTIYNLIKDIMWYYNRNHGHYTAPTEQEDDSKYDSQYHADCEEEDWDCWKRHNMDCEGPLCGYDGFVHPEYAGTDMEGPQDRHTHKTNYEMMMCWKDGEGVVFCPDPEG